MTEVVGWQQDRRLRVIESLSADRTDIKQSEEHGLMLLALQFVC